MFGYTYNTRGGIRDDSSVIRLSALFSKKKGIRYQDRVYIKPDRSEPSSHHIHEGWASRRTSRGMYLCPMSTGNVTTSLEEKCLYRVDLSPLQLKEGDLTKRVRQILRKTPGYWAAFGSCRGEHRASYYHLSQNYPCQNVIRSSAYWRSDEVGAQPYVSNHPTCPQTWRGYPLPSQCFRRNM